MLLTSMMSSGGKDLTRYINKPGTAQARLAVEENKPITQEEAKRQRERNDELYIASVRGRKKGMERRRIIAEAKALEAMKKIEAAQQQKEETNHGD